MGNKLSGCLNHTFKDGKDLGGHLIQPTLFLWSITPDVNSLRKKTVKKALDWGSEDLSSNLGSASSCLYDSGQVTSCLHTSVFGETN